MRCWLKVKKVGRPGTGWAWLLLLLLGSGAARAQSAAPELLDSLNREVIRLTQEGKYAEGIKLGDGLVRQARQQLGSMDLNYAAYLNNVANLYKVAGHYPEAETRSRECLLIAYERCGPIHLTYAVALNNMGSLCQEMGRYVEAEQHLQEALKIVERQLVPCVPCRLEYALVINNLSLLYQATGRYAEAEPLNLTGLAILEDELGIQHPDYATALNNLALLYEATGRYTESESRHLFALAITRQYPGPHHPDYANSLTNLAHLYQEMGHPADALPLSQEALAIYEQQFGQHSPLYAIALNNVAGCYRAMRRYSEAVPRYLKVLAIRKQVLAPLHPDYANSLNSLAGCYQALGRYPEAEARYAEALAINKRVFGTQNRDYAQGLSNLACLYQDKGDYYKSEAAGAQSLTTLLWHLRRNFTGLSEREQQQFLATVMDNFEVYHSLLAQLSFTAPHRANPTHAYDNLLLAKGLLLAATTSMQRQVAASSDTALHRRFGQWQDLKHQLAAARALPLAQQQGGFDPAPLEYQANKLEKELAAKSAAFRQGTRLPTATWRQVQRALKPGEVAIELVRYRWYRRTWTSAVYYSAYVVTPTGSAPQLVVLRNGHDLERRYLPAYRRFTHTVGKPRGERDVNDQADAALADAKGLYRVFWQPIARHLPPGTRTIYLSADGIYHQLNLATLQNPATGRYLLDEVDVRLVGSTRELVPSPVATSLPQPGASLLVGAPAYRLGAVPRPAPTPAGGAFSQSVSSQGGLLLAAGEVEPLRGTAREITQLDSLFAAAGRPHHTYIGAAATEEAVRGLHHPQVLHIATHGLFVPAARAKAGSAGPMLAATHPADASDPLLRSGLLLAGVSDFRDAQPKPATEDGILTAYEAALLDLQGTELVVLSACETGLGQVQYGEGVYGLQRGFAVAGARAMLMSLWKVDDAVTEELMVAFYKKWLGGQTKRAALLAAQRQVRRTHPAPYYWGAFVLVGE